MSVTFPCENDYPLTTATHPCPISKLTAKLPGIRDNRVWLTFTQVSTFQTGNSEDAQLRKKGLVTFLWKSCPCSVGGHLLTAFVPHVN